MGAAAWGSAGSSLRAAGLLLLLCTATQVFGSGKRPRVLILPFAAEESGAIRRQLQHRLQTDGWEVLTVGEYSEARQRMRLPITLRTVSAYRQGARALGLAAIIAGRVDQKVTIVLRGN